MCTGGFLQKKRELSRAYPALGYNSVPPQPRRTHPVQPVGTISCGLSGGEADGWVLVRLGACSDAQQDGQRLGCVQIIRRDAHQ